VQAERSLLIMSAPFSPFLRSIRLTPASCVVLHLHERIADLFD
jgi:hypothetical protein